MFLDVSLTGLDYWTDRFSSIRYYVTLIIEDYWKKRISDISDILEVSLSVSNLCAHIHVDACVQFREEWSLNPMSHDTAGSE